MEPAVAVALQILASGFAAGAVYGLVAVGHSLVFRLTGVVHLRLQQRPLQQSEVTLQSPLAAAQHGEDEQRLLQQ